jgi:O-acetyl-ADP-ribose deacetylase (regulator of RNase III)
MPTLFTKGDLFNEPGISAFAHGCDCAGGMSAGVAAAFKKRWPRMFEEYALRCKDGRFRLGDVFVWNEGSETVYNLAIQEHWKTKAKYPALVSALEKMLPIAEAAGIERIALPRIGAGLGGLDFPRVKRILTDVGADSKVTLVVFDQYIRKPSPTAAT